LGIGTQGGQILDGLLQGKTVIQAGTDHHLQVHLDVSRSQPPQLPEDIRGLGIIQEKTPKAQVAGMNGDEEGAETLFRDPAPIPFREIGEGDIIAMEEGETIVLILMVEGAAQARGHLIHKTEKAPIVAGSDGKALKLQPQSLVPLLPDSHLPQAPGFVEDAEPHHPLC
jgi:hypothetical protein